MTQEAELQPESEDLEDQEIDSELAPETDEVDEGDEVDEVDDNEGEEVEEKADDPAGYTKAINKKHFEFKEQERRANALEEQLRKLQSQMPQEQRPEVPELPDPYDDNYAEQIAARDDAIRKAVAYDTQQQFVQYQQQQAQEQSQKAQQEAITKTVQSYSGRAKDLGVKPEQLTAAGNTVHAYGIHDEITQYILGDEQGPLITTYLARHTDELEKISGMSPMQAGIYIDKAVRPKASVSPKKSQAPAPADGLTGGGAPPSERGPKGAKYE